MPLLNSAPILDDFDRSSVTVTTYAASTIDALGRAIAGAPSAVARNPVVHTTPERDLQNLPDSIRPREAITIYDTIGYGSPDDTTHPDRVTYQGRSYRVISVADYAEHGEIYIMIAGLEDASS